MKIIKIYLMALSLFFVIDLFWLGFFAKNFYFTQLGEILRPKVLWLPAVLFYLIFIAGLVYFVIFGNLENKTLVSSFLQGAFFGLITYATYDLTNLATLQIFSWRVVVVDLLWGSFLSGIVSLLTCFLFIYCFNGK